VSAIAEKYSRAIGSSHLEWRIDPGAIDMLTAAGMTEETLGTGLLRLRAEFDVISCMSGARHLASRLKTAQTVRIRLMALIFKRTDDEGIQAKAHEIASKLLDHWLSPQCPSCTGRGQIGEYGTQQAICAACNGSKRRSLFWRIEEQAIADRIGAEMESKVDAASRRIQRLLRHS